MGSHVEITDEMLIVTLRRINITRSSVPGARTYQIAEALGAGYRRPEIYRKLRRLQAQGLVVRNERYSAVNDIYWELAPKRTNSDSEGRVSL